MFLATVVLSAAFQPNFIGADFARNALYAAALLVFAVGIRGGGSITARRPLGTVTLVVLAALILFMPIAEGIIFSGEHPSNSLLAFGYTNSFAQFALALIAATQIARAGVVPRPWNWLPLWILAAVSVLWFVQQIAAGNLAPETIPLILTTARLDGLVRNGASAFLGVLAIVLATRPDSPRTVSV